MSLACHSEAPVDRRASDHDSDDPELADLAPERRSVWIERVTRVEEELARLPDHPWAGVYRTGDGFDRIWTLRIAPESGFTWTWAGCGGTTDRNLGPVREEDGVLHLACEWPNAYEPWTSGCPETLSIVARNDWLYLVHDWDHFRREAERGWEPVAMVLTRVDDDTRSVAEKR